MVGRLKVVLMLLVVIPNTLQVSGGSTRYGSGAQPWPEATRAQGGAGDDELIVVLVEICWWHRRRDVIWWLRRGTFVIELNDASNIDIGCFARIDADVMFFFEDGFLTEDPSWFGH